ARDVCGPGGRTGADPPAVREAPAPVHAGVARGVPVDPRCEGAPARDPRLSAGPAPPAGRLPLCRALPPRDRPLPRRASAAARGRRRAGALSAARTGRGGRIGEGGRRVSEALLRTEGLTRHFS